MLFRSAIIPVLNIDCKEKGKSACGWRLGTVAKNEVK